MYISMNRGKKTDVTQILQSVRNGEESMDRLFEQVYSDLKVIARSRLENQRSGHTLNTTGLVHEAYLKMIKYQDVDWQGKTHFFGAAAQTMRRILIDYARSKRAQKRNGLKVNLSLAEDSLNMSFEQLLELDEILDRLAEIRPRWVKIIECRYFAGLTIKETAEVVKVSHTTVTSEWRLARAWLKRELNTASVPVTPG